jgi:hypothetical protein
VDLDQLVQVSGWMAARLGRPAPSRVVTARYRETAEDALF